MPVENGPFLGDGASYCIDFLNQQCYTTGTTVNNLVGTDIGIILGGPPVVSSSIEKMYESSKTRFGF
jgi:hypothetical protein